MLRKIKGLYFVKIMSIVLSAQIFATAIGLNSLYAQDGGPTQPEVHSFEPIGTNQMVDLFTGDFTYNIPLFNIPGPDGGYPINLAYHSGIQMEQEASWVGLGWNINVGTINRQVRNLPDDFGNSAEDVIKIKTDMNPDWTVGVGAGFSPELVGFDGPVAINNVSASIYYNNYRGIGYQIGIGLDPKIPGLSVLPGDLGFNLSLDSQGGVSADVTLGLSKKINKNNNASISANTGFNSRTGWQQKINIQAQAGSININRPHMKHSFPIGVSGTLSFAGDPQGLGVPLQMRGGNGALSFATGGNLFGFEGKLNINAYFSFSLLKDRDKELSYSGIGYMYYQNSHDAFHSVSNDMRIKDVSRENDGLIHKNTRRLATPTQDYDVYSVTGQGIGNMFRPYRYDIGTNVEPRRKSEFHGGNFGLELPLSSPVNMRAGFDLGYNYASSKVDFWPNSNAANFPFVHTNPSLSSSVYFQNYGEQSVDDLTSNYGYSVASNKPVVFGLNNNDGFYDINNIDQNDNGSVININNTRTTRKRRAMGIEAYTNKIILNTDNNSTVIPEFDISYYNSTSGSGYNKSSLVSYNSVRSSRPRGHVAGYSAMNTAGVRYVYGLAAYNNKDRNVTFSVSESVAMLSQSKIPTPITSGGDEYKATGTNKFYQSIEKSSYAHSYMLTSILGKDYVEFDNIPGPSNGDLGYWVKFDYARAHSNLSWRTPYDGVIYNKGNEMSFKDGKGSYAYGEKEVWYLATAETKTHIAEFII